MIYNLRVNGNPNNGCYMYVILLNILKEALSLTRELFPLGIIEGYIKALIGAMSIILKGLFSTILSHNKMKRI